MSGTSRLLTEMKQSPAKAAFLGIGVIVAAVVWGPRLFEGSGSKPTTQPNTSIESESDAPDSTEDPRGIARRDPASIRSEFIRVSEEARDLRTVAERLEMMEIERDPFAVDRNRVVIGQPVEREPGDEHVTDAESDFVSSLELQGIFHFSSGCSAVLNGEVLRVGQQISGLTVVDIRDRSVILRGRQRDYSLDMEDEKED